MDYGILFGEDWKEIDEILGLLDPCDAEAADESRPHPAKEDPQILRASPPPGTAHIDPTWLVW